MRASLGLSTVYSLFNVECRASIWWHISALLGDGEMMSRSICSTGRYTDAAVNKVDEYHHTQEWIVWIEDKS